jgi:hypothetical protein
MLFHRSCLQFLLIASQQGLDFVRVKRDVFDGIFVQLPGEGANLIRRRGIVGKQTMNHWEIEMNWRVGEGDSIGGESEEDSEGSDGEKFKGG